MKKTLIILALIISIPTLTQGQNGFKVEQTGNGKTILFLPGFATPGSVWNETIANLEGNFESHSFTYAGFDGVDPIKTPWYSGVLEAITTYIESENLSDITVIGHSMGGNLAIDLSYRFPDRISDLILVESIPCMREVMMPGVSAESLAYESPYNQQTLSLSQHDFENMVKGITQHMTLKPEKVGLLTEWSMNSDRKTYVYGYTDLLKLDLRNKLSSIKARVLILGAGFPNEEMVRSTYENQYSLLNTKEIEIVNDSRHFIMFDQPEWFYSKVNQFLAVNE